MLLTVCDVVVVEIIRGGHGYSGVWDGVRKVAQAHVCSVVFWVTVRPFFRLWLWVVQVAGGIPCDIVIGRRLTLWL